MVVVIYLVVIITVLNFIFFGSSLLLLLSIYWSHIKFILVKLWSALALDSLYFPKSIAPNYLLMDFLKNDVPLVWTCCQLSPLVCILPSWMLIFPFWMIYVSWNWIYFFSCLMFLVFSVHGMYCTLLYPWLCMGL